MCERRNIAYPLAFSCPISLPSMWRTFHMSGGVDAFAHQRDLPPQSAAHGHARPVCFDLVRSTHTYTHTVCTTIFITHVSRQNVIKVLMVPPRTRKSAHSSNSAATRLRAQGGGSERNSICMYVYVCRDVNETAKQTHAQRVTVNYVPAWWPCRM